MVLDDGLYGTSQSEVPNVEVEAERHHCPFVDLGGYVVVVVQDGVGDTSRSQSKKDWRWLLGWRLRSHVDRWLLGWRLLSHVER